MEWLRRQEKNSRTWCAGSHLQKVFPGGILAVSNIDGKLSSLQFESQPLYRAIWTSLVICEAQNSGTVKQTPAGEALETARIDSLPKETHYKEKEKIDTVTG